MTSIRVATYNLYLGADLTLMFDARDERERLERARLVLDQLEVTDFTQRSEAIARLIARERLDLVGLQEVSRWTRGGITADGGFEEPVLWCDFLEALQTALEATGETYDAYAGSPNFSGAAAVSQTEYVSVVGANVILVRRDSAVTVRSERTGSYRRTLAMATPIPGLELGVPRSWGAVDAEVDGRRFRFVNTHTEAYDGPTRDAQRDEMLAEVADTEWPLVIVGDFNAGPEMVGMPAAYQDAWLVAGDGGAGVTCGQAADLGNVESLLHERIDYVWVRGAEVLGCAVAGNTQQDRSAVGRRWPSDHACVSALVQL